MSENLREQLLLLPGYFQGHLILTISAMLAGILVSVPLGILAQQSIRVRTPLLATVSIIQTIPSLAILALTVALLGGRIGFIPAFIALTLYCMLPIIRNTLTGLEGVPGNVVEAARGIGMTKSQSLVQVRLPLALPVIIAGIRTATVWTVGLATLSTLVGATSFGNYIFTGIQTRNLVAVTVGSVAAALMAIILDGLIGGVQWLAENRLRNDQGRKPVLIKGAVSLGAVIMLSVSLFALVPRPEADILIGGKPFTEQYILAGLLAAELEARGLSTEQRLGLGSDVIYQATQNGNVDVYLEYTGTIWANQMREEVNPGRMAVQRAVIDYVNQQPGMVAIGPSGFQNLYALAMRKDRAAELGVTTIEDLIPIASELSCGADLEFFGRPEWISLRDTYNIDFADKLTFDATLMYSAVNDRQVDLITAYTTDGRVSAYDLLLLEDPRNALLPYDGLFVASEEAASNDVFMSVISELVNRIDDEMMREANRIVDVDGRSVGDAVMFLQTRLAENQRL
jgi:osmoprotectant transport system permease protein